MSKNLINIAKLGALVESAKSGIVQLAAKSNEETPKIPVEHHEEEKIETVEQLENSIMSLSGEMSPAMFQVLKSQLQVLNTISSPTMTGMMIDNLVQGLCFSMKDADSNSIPSIRESYIRLIQNYIFMAEAKMHYVVDKNKEEAIQLLTECGKMLADTFVDVAAITIPVGKSAKIVKSVSKDMFKIAGTNGKNILPTLISLFTTKKTIEEKQDEFFRTVEDLFDTFEKHTELFGKSIVINGMLSKYRKILVERFTDAKVRVIKNRKSVAELQNINKLSDEITKTLKNGDLLGMASAGLKSAFDIVLARKATQYDLQTFFIMYDAFDAEVKELKITLESEEKRLKALEQDKKKIGIFNFSEKKEASQSIEGQLAKLGEVKKEVKNAEKKLRELKEYLPEAKAIKEEINRYESRLKRIEQQYLS